MATYGSASFDNDFAASRDGSSDSKQIFDLLFGVTQVIDRNTLMQFNYSLSSSSGYLTDPYKVVSVIDDAAGANYGGNYADGLGNVYLYEERPDARLKHALFWQGKRQLQNGDIVDLSYRFMFDRSEEHTSELQSRENLVCRLLLEKQNTRQADKVELARVYQA